MIEIPKKATTAPILRTLLFVFIGSLLILGLGCKKATNAASTSEAPQKTTTKPVNTENKSIPPAATPAATNPAKKETATQETLTKAPDEKTVPTADIADAGTTGTSAKIITDVEDTAAKAVDTESSDTDTASADADTASSQDTDAAANSADTADTETTDGLDTDEQPQEANTEEPVAPQDETDSEGTADEASDDSDKNSNDSGATETDGTEQESTAGGDTTGQQAANVAAPPQAQFDDEGREIVTGENGGQAVVMDADPTTGALTEQERLQLVLLCGQLACLHEVSEAMPRDQASKLLLTQLGFAQTDYEKHLPGIFGDQDAGGACDGMRSLCSDNPDREEPTGRLNRTQKRLLAVLVALVNGPAVGETLKAVDGATVMAAYKELQANPLFAREFLNASWGYVQAQAPTPAVAPGPMTPRTPKPPQAIRNAAPATYRFVGSLSDSAGNTTGTIRFRVKDGRITHGSVSLNGQTYAMPSSTVERDGQFSAGAKAGKDFLQLTGEWKTGRSWIRGTYSGFASRKRVRGIFSLATR